MPPWLGIQIMGTHAKVTYVIFMSPISTQSWEGSNSIFLLNKEYVLNTGYIFWLVGFSCQSILKRDMIADLKVVLCNSKSHKS